MRLETFGRYSDSSYVRLHAMKLINHHVHYSIDFLFHPYTCRMNATLLPWDVSLGFADTTLPTSLSNDVPAFGCLSTAFGLYIEIQWWFTDTRCYDITLIMYTTSR